MGWYRRVQGYGWWSKGADADSKGWAGEWGAPIDSVLEDVLAVEADKKVD